MNKTFSLLFFVKKSKTIANGTAPIYLRITIDGKPTEIAAKRYINPEKWNSEAQKVSGITEDIKALNSYLKTLEQQVFDAHHQLLKDKLTVTAESLKNRLVKKEEKQRTLIPIFEDHNKRIKALIGQEYAPGTVKRYETSLKHTLEFIKWKYSVSDIEIYKIDHSFITDYEFYLRSIRKCNNNSTVKYIKNFGKIIRICLDNDWLDKNPFAKYKAKVKQVDRVYLNKEELEAMHAKVFSIERLNLVKDIFLFSCYTGLAYIDLKNLNNQHISIGIEGSKWIFTNRQKTDTQSNIPLLPMAEQLLDKYSKHPQCINKNMLLPILSNQKMNSYLKEIADLCKINKPLTFHIARHTFATTVTLNNGVSIESVSKMLGHKDLKTTQHYAKILDRKVSDDMMLLKSKLLSETNFVSIENFNKTLGYKG